MNVLQFIEKCQKRPLPNNPLNRLKTFARELAEGSALNLWNVNLTTKGLKDEHVYMKLLNTVTNLRDHPDLHDFDNLADQLRAHYDAMSRQYVNYEIRGIIAYLCIRWNYAYPDLYILRNNGYLLITDSEIQLTSKAFDLLEEADGANIFISYRRSESSALALLIRDRLQQYSLEAFVDMQLQAGVDWQEELAGRIKESDYLILLLGKRTLDSQVTIQEISWALESDTTLIPLWLNGFIYQEGDWPNLPQEVASSLRNTHTIRVIEENPLTYDTALRELLNRFGISA